MSYTEQVENTYILPICHYHIEFAHLVRQAIDGILPQAIAVELPRTLESKIRQGIERLPFLSALLVETKREDPIYWIIEPADPLIEAVRYGQEKGIPVFFVDVDTGDYPLFRDPLPDPYAILRVGHESYYRSFQDHVLGHMERSPQDRIRE